MLLEDLLCVVRSGSDGDEVEETEERVEVQVNAPEFRAWKTRPLGVSEVTRTVTARSRVNQDGSVPFVRGPDIQHGPSLGACNGYLLT